MNFFCGENFHNAEIRDLRKSLPAAAPCSSFGTRFGRHLSALDSRAAHLIKGGTRGQGQN